VNTRIGSVADLDAVVALMDAAVEWTKDLLAPHRSQARGGPLQGGRH
jgi:hypothetical protein